MIEFVGFILFMYFCPAFRKQVMGQDKLMRRIEQRFAKGIIKYGLIEDGDKVLVGLSGGKTHWLCWNCWLVVRVSLNLVSRLWLLSYINE